MWHTHPPTHPHTHTHTHTHTHIYIYIFIYTKRKNNFDLRNKTNSFGLPRNCKPSEISWIQGYLKLLLLCKGHIIKKWHLKGTFSHQYLDNKWPFNVTNWLSLVSTVLYWPSAKRFTSILSRKSERYKQKIKFKEKERNLNTWQWKLTLKSRKSAFRAENCAITGSDATCSGNSLPTFIENPSVRYSKVDNPRRFLNLEDVTDRWSRNVCK